MTQSQPVLQPKLSPVYNKIIQLISAVAIVIALLAFWESTSQVNQRTLLVHFELTAKRSLHQASSGVLAILTTENNKSSKQVISPSELTPSNKVLMQNYINNLMQADYIKQVHFYAQDGQLLYQAESDQNLYASLEHGKQQLSINEIYGLNGIYLDKSASLKPFIIEIRRGELLGYLRLTLDKSLLMNSLHKSEVESKQNLGFMLIMAGLVGFLLTRGLNRFSRQGYRPS
jgi:membrane protein